MDNNTVILEIQNNFFLPNNMRVQLCGEGKSFFRPASIKEKQLIALIKAIQFSGDNCFLRYLWISPKVGMPQKISLACVSKNAFKEDIKSLAHLCQDEDETLNKAFQTVAQYCGELETKILDYKKLHWKIFGNIGNKD